MEAKRELRTFEFEVRAERDETHGAVLLGRPIVYESATEIYDPWIGTYTEIIDRGALDNTDLTDVRFLVNHNTDMIPLARSRRNTANSTMQMTVADEGMDIRVDLDVDNNTEAKALYSAVGRGDITGMSFMFSVDSDFWEDIDTAKPIRHIRSFKRVYEVSAVTFPAYSQTSISQRGLSDALESAKDSLESARAAKREVERKKQRIRMLTEVL